MSIFDQVINFRRIQKIAKSHTILTYVDHRSPVWKIALCPAANAHEQGGQLHGETDQDFRISRQQRDR